MLNIFRKSNAKEVDAYYKEWTSKYIDSFGDTFQSHRPDNLQDYFKYLGVQLGLQENMHVMDAGCGIGGPLFGVQQYYPNNAYLGLNLSGIQIDIANERIAQDKLENISFKQGDFHQMTQSVELESFDRVFFLESLVHSCDVAQVISETKKILKPYGKIYIKDLYRRVAIDKNDEALISKSIKVNNDLFKMNIDTKENLLLELRKNGFKLDFCKLLDIDANQNVGNEFVIKNGLVKSEADWHPYLEWYEIRATKVVSCFD